VRIVSGSFSGLAVHICERQGGEKASCIGRWNEISSAFRKKKKAGVLCYWELYIQNCRDKGERTKRYTKPFSEPNLGAHCDWLGGVDRRQGGITRTGLPGHLGKGKTGEIAQAQTKPR
jgi:hypothetical protein